MAAGITLQIGRPFFAAQLEIFSSQARSVGFLDFRSRVWLQAASPFFGRCRAKADMTDQVSIPYISVDCSRSYNPILYNNA
jgi:hypothetical protein